MNDISVQLEQYGFAVVPDVLDETAITGLIAEFERAACEEERATDDRVFAMRNLFEAIPAVKALAASRSLRALVEPVLGSGCMAVKATFFDKVPDANWKVPWHQDLSVALAGKRDVEGFGSWSCKANVLHAQAPVSLLERMLAVRLHLDPCDLNNGPLRVLPGTHRYGRLNSEDIKRLRSEVTEATCEVERGGVLLMRPLLLHASSSAQSPRHRRVIHIEYAVRPLPGGLEWHEAVSAE